MASLKTFLPFWIVSCVIAGNPNSFVKLKCNSENHGLYGQQSVLVCVVQTAKEAANAKIEVVTWRKMGVETPLLVYKGERKPISGAQFAEPEWNEKNMNVSLLLTNTQIADAGGYECMVMTDSGSDDTALTRLTVTAKYHTPTIKSMPEKDIPVTTHVTLFCNSSGGYPKGQILWFDEHGSDRTSSSELEAKLTDDGLFNLTSKLTLVPRSTYSKYRCSVLSDTGGKEGEATFGIAYSQFSGTVQPDTASRIVAPVVVIGSLIIGLLCTLLFIRRRYLQATGSSTVHLMSDHQPVDTHDRDVDGGGTGTKQL